MIWIAFVMAGLVLMTIVSVEYFIYHTSRGIRDGEAPTRAKPNQQRNPKERSTHG